ncbi:MAG: AI-2E family transporter, partial [Ruminococcus sp.]|nr:AI-2E family transporter [Ruminococcus sp.]
ACFQVPYATMIGALVGITAVIPVAGAFIGAGVGTVMIFTVSPFKSLLFLLFFLVLQQIEENLIYPRVVGKSVGLPSLLVLIAVTFGAGIGGICGILLSVPVASALYRLLCENVSFRENNPHSSDTGAV